MRKIFEIKNIFKTGKFKNTLNSSKISPLELYNQYSNGLDSIDLTSSIEVLKLKVDYLLSQDLKYQKEKDKTQNKNRKSSINPFDNISQNIYRNIGQDFRLPSMISCSQLPQQQLISPLKDINLHNFREKNEDEESKVEKFIKKKKLTEDYRSSGQMIKAAETKYLILDNSI